MTTELQLLREAKNIHEVWIRGEDKPAFASCLRLVDLTRAVFEATQFQDPATNRFTRWFMKDLGLSPPGLSEEAQIFTPFLPGLAHEKT